MEGTLKKNCTIGCCGIDCGLCPRFHTKGDSACPGCGGENFKEKHPSCGFLTCCAIRKGFEVCSDCREYPCKRFDPEKNGYDSFVSHRKVFSNLDFIKNKGMDSFIDEQIVRMDILTTFLALYDDGRSKSFFCISCTLLPVDKLTESITFIQNRNDFTEIREKNKVLKDWLKKCADEIGIDLNLRKK